MADGLFRIAHVKFPKAIINIDQVKREIRKAADEIGEKIDDDLNSTVEHWVHKPTFKHVLHMYGTRGDLVMTTRISGSVRAVKYWNYVDKGTKKRYVIFHPKYQQKTVVPGKFHSNSPGYIPTVPSRRGRAKKMKIVGKSFTPLRGIRARKWTELARKKYAKPFFGAMGEAIKRGLEE